MSKMSDRAKLEFISELISDIEDLARLHLTHQNRTKSVII